MKKHCVAVVAGVLALASQAARAADVPERFRVKSFAEVMAPTTLFFLEIPDYARARAAYRATPRWKFWWEGAGRKFISQMIRSGGDDDLTAAWRAFAESAKLSTGKVAFAIEGPDPEDEMGMPMTVLLAEVGPRAREFMGHVKKMLGEGLVEEDEAVVQGMRFTEMDELFVGSDGGLVMGGFGKVAINGLLSRFAERPWQNLAGNPAYRLAKSRALEGAHFMTFTNYTDIWRMAAMEFDEDWLPIERTGLPQLAATSLSGRFTPEGVVDKVSFILRGRARGMWEILRPEPLSRKAWGLIPDFASGFVAFRIPERTKGFLDMLRALDREMAEEFLEPFREFREETGINFEKDLLRLTTGEFTAVFLEEDPDRRRDQEPDRRRGMMMGEEKFFRHVVLLVELKDPARARAMMDRLARVRFDMDESLGRKRRYGRLDGWELGDDIDGPLCVAGSGGIAFLALSPEPIERLAEHIAKRGPRLVDLAEFRKAMAWIPAGTGFAAYSNVRKIMRSLHKLVSVEAERMGRGRRSAPMGRAPVTMPKLDEFLEGLSPLTACVRIEKPGFAFEIHSPDGIWAFYFQLMGHFLWRFDEEPMQARRQARAPRMPGPPALDGVDPEVTKAYADLRRRLAHINSPQLRIAELTRAKPKFAGTPYVRVVDASIMREKTALVAALYNKTIATMVKLKTPEARAKFLAAKLPEFAGTTFEKRIEAMIAREKAMIAKKKAVAERAARGAAPAARPAAPQGLTAKVLAVRPQVNLVMLSAGREDGVQKGAVFAIRRNGLLIGKVAVERVFTDMSSARIIADETTGTIREDDEAVPDVPTWGDDEDVF